MAIYVNTDWGRLDLQQKMDSNWNDFKIQIVLSIAIVACRTTGQIDSINATLWKLMPFAYFVDA